MCKRWYFRDDLNEIFIRQFDNIPDIPLLDNKSVTCIRMAGILTFSPGAFRSVLSCIDHIIGKLNPAGIDFRMPVQPHAIQFDDNLIVFIECHKIP